MANQEHLAKIKEGVEAWNKWRIENPMIVADLSNAKLDYMNFRDIQLTVVNLSGASLRGVDFGRSVIYMAELANSDFSGSIFGFTKLLDTDLSEAYGLESVMHVGPSTIGVDTIIRSKGVIPEIFLRNIGIPSHIIESIFKQVGNIVEPPSCFISYSHKDEEFAKKLHSDLQKNEVRCWYAPEDMKIGDKIRQTIEYAIMQRDKLLLVLSEHSINSMWVEKEIETAFEKELHKGTILFPIRLDTKVMTTNKSWAADIRRTRHIGDFSNWKSNLSYLESFERLMRDLKAS